MKWFLSQLRPVRFFASRRDPPHRSAFSDHVFASSGPLSQCVLQCCSFPIHLQCITDLVHESSQSEICPACNSQSPSSLDFIHFQHLCCVHHVEAPAVTTALSAHRTSVLSDPSMAASLEHLDISIDFNAPPANSTLNPIFPLCCAHICGPPDFEPLNDRRMEWSPIHPSVQGSSSDWVLQWVCRSCGSSTSHQDIPALPAASCPQCSSSAAIVFDRPTGHIVRLCV